MLIFQEPPNNLHKSIPLLPMWHMRAFREGVPSHCRYFFKIWFRHPIRCFIISSVEQQSRNSDYIEFSFDTPIFQASNHEELRGAIHGHVHGRIFLDIIEPFPLDF